MATPKVSCDILIVDDDEAIRDALTMMLEEEGYVVSSAAHGRDALRQLGGGLRPQLILLDWKMPIMNGQQFRLAQQADPMLAEIPVAVISAHAFDSIVESVDADAYLSKPIPLAQLLATVAQFCST